MRNTVTLGFGIAVLFAAGVFAVSVFGKHDDWFLRAARANAVRCLAKAPCTRIDAKGVVVKEAPPLLTAANRCAQPENWHDAKIAAGGKPVFAVTCRNDSMTYLYHLGRLAGAGEEQWMVCGTPDCTREFALLKERVN